MAAEGTHPKEYHIMPLSATRRIGTLHLANPVIVVKNSIDVAIGRVQLCVS